MTALYKGCFGPKTMYSLIMETPSPLHLEDIEGDARRFLDSFTLSTPDR